MIELGLFAIAAFWVVCAVLCYGMVMAVSPITFTIEKAQIGRF